MTDPRPHIDNLHVIFVCWGNICRSPMAERIAVKMAADQGVAPPLTALGEGVRGVKFTSAATSSDELGNPMDPRAAHVLLEHGYDPSGHIAHQISRDEVRQADLVIGMEQLHLDILSRLVPGTDNLALLTDFDTGAKPGSPVRDPWYGPRPGFVTTLIALESAMPGVLDWVRGRVG